MGISLSEYLSDGALTVDDIPSEKHPEGTSYRITSPNAKTWLWLQNVGRVDRLTDDEKADVEANLGDQDIDRHILGDALDLMAADGVAIMHVHEIAQVAYAYFMGGQTAADRVVNSTGKAPETTSSPDGTKSSPDSGATETSTSTPVSLPSSPSSDLFADQPEEQTA